MSSVKLPGPKLFFSRFGGEQPIPPEFLAAMNRQEEVQAVPNDVGPEALSDTIVESEVKTDRTGERVRHTIKKDAGFVGPLRFIHTDEKGQQVQAVRYMYRTGTVQQTIPNAYTTVSVQDLGNTWSIEEASIGGVYSVSPGPGGEPVFTPGLFPAPTFERTNPSAYPPEYLADVDVITTQVDAAGTAVAPSKLSSDKYKETQEQVTQYKKRTTMVTQVQPTIPKILDLGKETNQVKQQVSVVKTILSDATLPEIPTEVKDVEVRQLGDGHKEQIVKTVTLVFPATIISKEIDDVVPPEFHTDAPNLTTETTGVGTAASPALGATELQHTETQVATNIKKTRSTVRTSTLPITRNDVSLDGLRVGGKTFDGAVTLVRKLSTQGQSILTGFKTIFARSKDLGPTHSLLETASITTFPTLTDNITDLDTGLIRNRFHDIVAGGAALPATAFTSQEQINKDHTLRIQEVADAASFTGYLRMFVGFTNIDFPAQLVTVFATNSKGGGNGGFSEGGFFSLAGNGSGSLSLAGQAQASDMLAPDVYFDIRQPWGNNIPCTHLLFLVPSGESRANVLAKCTSAMGATVNDWPKFAPAAANFVCVGENVSATVRVTASKTASVRVDYTGAVIGGGSIAESSGGGTSIESTKTVRIVRLPPTIHPNLSNGSGFSGVFGNLTGDGHTAPAQITTVGSGTQLTAVAQAFGLITPTSLGATTGTGAAATAIPTSGLYLVRLYSEPGTLGYIKMHAEVVNMANVV